MTFFQNVSNFYFMGLLMKNISHLDKFFRPWNNIILCLLIYRYDPKENKWTKVASMMTRRLGVAVAVLHGYLYAIGGSDGQNPLNSVERYDPQKNTWTVMAPMSTRRKHLGCAVYNNMIYAVGGRDDCTELSSAGTVAHLKITDLSLFLIIGKFEFSERYNPATNTWSPIVAMMSRRSGVSPPKSKPTGNKKKFYRLAQKFILKKSYLLVCYHFR